MANIIKVGMADLNTCVSPDGITTLGLGSCVGIAIRDPLTKIGGLAHVMLPDSTEIKNNLNIYKFADTGIEELVRLLVEKGASRARLVAKIAGGAQMFAFQNKSDLVRVGERNVQASKKKLAEVVKGEMLAVKKKFRDPRRTVIVGSEEEVKTERFDDEKPIENFGRTVIFYPETGDYVIRTAGKPERVI